MFLTCVYGRLREDFQGVCSDELDDIFILLVCFGFCISPVYSREIGVPLLNIPVTPISRELVYILAYKGFKNKSPRNTNTPKHPPLNPPFF